MTARLGNALYGLGCLFALAVFMLTANYQYIGMDPSWPAAALYASVFWLAGRVCRYVLAGK